MFQDKRDNGNAQKLLFIDAAIQDQATLLKAVRSEYRITKLKSDCDPVIQITNTLAGNGFVQEIILVAHARSGQIVFSNYELDSNELSKRSKEFEAWQKSFISNQTKIFVYACELARGEVGRDFIQQLKNLTGAEIAASSLTIGQWDGKQNWNLDFLTKPFEVLMPFSGGTIEYPHCFAPVVSVTGNSELEGDDETGSSQFLTFDINISEPSTSDIQLGWLARDDRTNSTEMDYIGSDQLVIPAGEASASILLEIYGDTIIEPDERVVFEVFNLSGAEFESGAQRLTTTVFILDDDSGYRDPSLFVNDIELVEGDNDTQNAVFTVQLSRPKTFDLTFDYQTADGSATAGSDYTATSGSLIFPAGQTEAEITVPVIGDTLLEAEESFNLVVRAQGISQFFIDNGDSPAVGTAHIITDDAAGIASQPIVSIRDSRITEIQFGLHMMEFEIILSEPSSGEVSMGWQSLPGTAKINDLGIFGALGFPAGTVTFSPGQTTAFVNFVIPGDPDIEDEIDESLLLELFNPKGAEFAGGVDRLLATGTILSTDNLPELRTVFINDAELVEGDSGSQNAVFKVLLSRPAATDLTFDYQTVDGSATAGSDYTAANGALTFAAGQTEAVVNVAVTGDTLSETTESFTLLVRPQAGSDSVLAGGLTVFSAQALIVEDDNTATTLPVLSIRDTEDTEKTSFFGPGGFLKFEVVLSQPATNEISLSWHALPGTIDVSDIEPSNSSEFPAGNLVIPAGNTTAFIDLRITGDFDFEPDESVLLELYDLTGAEFAGGTDRLTATGIILNDDGDVAQSRTVFIKNVEQIEGSNASSLTFTVKLSRPASTDLAFDYQTADGTAIAGVDYTAVNGILTIPPGQTEAAIQVPVSDDFDLESDETFDLTLTPQGGGDTVTATATIISNDTESILNRELVVNGGAETGDTSGWVSTGIDAVPTTPSSEEFGDFAFTGGAGTAVQTLFQSVDVSNGASQIDTGHIQSNFSIYLQSITNNIVTDLASVDVTFVNNSGETLDSFSLVDDENIFTVGIGESNPIKQWKLFSDVRAVPAGTRSIEILLTADRNGGISSDGFIDQVSLQLGEALVSTGEDAYATINGLPLVVDTATGVLNNDAGNVGNTLTATVVDAPSHGSLNLNTDGSFSYAPDAGFTGTDTFTYRASDGVGLSTPTQVDITVSPISVSSPSVSEGNTGTQQAVFSIQLEQPLSTNLILNYQTIDGTAIAGEDYVAAGDSVTIPAGQTETTIQIAINGDTDLETEETFTLAITPQGGAETFNAAATIIADDVQQPPVAELDAYSVANGATLTVNVIDGVLTNDTDAEGDALTAAVVDEPSQGVLNLNADGSFTYTPNAGFAGTDTFTYRAFDGTDFSVPATVSITVDLPVIFAITGELIVPDSLNPGGTGTSQLIYENNSSTAIPGTLVFAQAIGGGLLADSLTGDYSDGIFLLGLGDGEGAIQVAETGALSFSTKMADAPNGSMTVSAAVADPSQTIDWAALETQLKPESMSDALWHRIYTNFQSEVGANTGEFIATLAENGQYLSSLGVRSDSAAAALSFELEQAGDFGSLVERETDGTAGRGWAFLGDLRLDIDTDGNATLLGSTLLGTLFTLNAEESAYYTVSSSVGQTVSLSGNVLSGVAPTRPIFSMNINGSYTTGGDFDGQLMRTADGFKLENAHGDALLFDHSGTFVKAITVNGLETIAAYDTAGRITSFTGPNGNILTINHDAAGNAISITDTNGQTMTLGYSADGDKLVVATGAAGTANFSYDGNDLSQAIAAGGPNIDFTYDSAGRLTSVSVAGGIEQTTFSYDSLGGYTVTDGAGRTAHISLAPGGQVAVITDSEAASASLQYSSQGKLVGIEFPDGTTAALSVDDLGRPTALADANGATLAYAYHDNFNVPVSFTDANGATRAFSYNDQGEMVQAAWADGTHLDFGYDANGQITDFSNRRGESVTYDYDARGRLTAESAGTSGAVSYTYDAAGNLLTATTNEGTTALTYDAANRVTQIEYPNGRSLSYTYDAAGNRTSMTDQDGNAQFYQYDAAGRLINLSNNDGSLVSYTYDAAGNLMREDNGNGTATTYSYDATGRLLEIFNLDAVGNENSRIVYSYDTAGQRTGMETADGAWTYGYDAVGQLTSAHFTSTRAGLADKQIEYAYDAAGNRISKTEDGVTTHYTTNALNQYVTAGGATLSYDADGNLITKTDSNGSWNYIYDLENRLTSVTTPTGDVTQYEYDVFGNRSAVIENGVRTEFLIDPFGLGNVIDEYAADGSLIASYAHGLGLAGRIAGDGSTAYYDIDGVGSVIGITDGSGNEVNRYGYTPFGNELFESEIIANSFEFNGALGVSEDANNLNYMRARFYDSDMGRFLSEDPLWTGGERANLYRFGINDPVENLDPLGLFSLRKIVDGIGKIGEGTLYAVSSIPLPIAGTYLAIKLAPTTIKNAITFSQHAYKFGPGAAVVALPTEAATTVGGVGQLYVAASFYNDPLGFVLKNLPGFKSIVEGILDIENGLGIIDDEIHAIALDLLAKSAGDPHLNTFDGFKYDFQAAGEFTLVHGIDSGLEIQVRQEPWGNSNLVSVNTAVAMQVGDDVVGIYRGQPNPVNINGEFVAITDGETVSVGDGSIYRQGNTYVVTNAQGDGFWARVGSFINVAPFLSTERQGEIAGLLGNADGDKTNDIALADGTVLTGPLTKQDLYGPFADSWRVTPETSLFVYGDGESTETFTIPNFPLRTISVNDLDPAVRAAAEEAVRNVGLTEGTIEFENAVLDVALTGEIEFAQAALELLQIFDPSTGLALTVGEQAQLNEGDNFSRQISFTDDVDSGDADRTYSIDWGDGSAIESGVLTSDIQLFDMTHQFVDGDASYTVSVTVEDGSDDIATQQFTVNVDNVAPIIALSGAAKINAGDNYTLNLGDIIDPGDDTVTSFIVNWGDGSSDIFNSAGDVSHIYSAAGSNTISVDLVDEDGTHANAGSLAVTVDSSSQAETISIGDAPLRISRSDPDAWEKAWENDTVSISHKANYLDTAESWSNVILDGRNSGALSGGDIFGGDLGVSGQTSISSTIRQEIDGTEALRFDLDQVATRVTIDLSRLEGDSTLGSFDAGRLQLLDGSGFVLDELTFNADAFSSDQQITLDHAAGFSSVVLTSGVYNDADFVFGGLSDAAGQYLSGPQDLGNGTWNASDYLVDAVEFEFGEITLVGIAG
ncbi:RHS repeat-associated core domain-containing protein [Nitrosomonas sp. Nm51]|uniref:Calx-beta domain-containing protein n=1 Tax=Nitrosomonas sp. Nm51 TaxID=133720 RepID=UPI0008D4DF77|nr:Calx-beta domain-containing protein [Nitrosomonas sp. Nm51]SER06606.1 RHS repeat-associated core domain-containing protein [Nitrosomonas sp. Nm51]